jgi:hypothetical protein
LLRRTFQIETIGARCKTLLRLIAVIKTDETIRKILAAMDLPTEGMAGTRARALSSLVETLPEGTLGGD